MSSLQKDCIKWC